MPVETGDKKGLVLGPGLDEAVVPDAAEGDGGRRRRRRGMRVPSDDVPRPQPTAPPAAADDDFDVDIDDPDASPVEIATEPPSNGVTEPAAGASDSPAVAAVEREISGPIVLAPPPAAETAAAADGATPPVIADEVETAPEPLADTLASAGDVPMPAHSVDEAVEPVEEHVEPLEEAVEPLEEPVEPLVAAPEAAEAGEQPAAAVEEPAEAIEEAEAIEALAEAVEQLAEAVAEPRQEAKPAEEPEPEELSSAELEEDQSPRPTMPPPRPRKLNPPAPPPAPSYSPAPSASPPPAPVPQAISAEPTGRRRKGKAWFEEVFDEDYLRTLPFLLPQTTQREAAFLLDALGGKPAQQLLDIGCGYGRHAMELAGRGHHVTALDLSLPLLLRGADEAQRRGLVINFVHGDMREMTYEAQFDGAYCFFSTFGYFDDDTNKRVAAAIGRSLKPGGRLVLDLLNRDYIVADLPTRIWWEGDGCVVLEEVDFNYYNSRLVSNRSVVFEDGRQIELEISIRTYSLHEVGKLLHSAGFRVLSVSGGLAARGRFFGKDSRQIIVVAERRGSESGSRDGSSSPLDSAANGKT